MVDKVAGYDQHVIMELFESEFDKRLITLIKEDMKQQMKYDSVKFQPISNHMYKERDKLDVEIDEIWVLVQNNYIKVKKYHKKKKIFTHKLQLNEKDYINK